MRFGQHSHPHDRSGIRRGGGRYRGKARGATRLEALGPATQAGGPSLSSLLLLSMLIGCRVPTLARLVHARVGVDVGCGLISFISAASYDLA
jgi:hypothetical protein